MENSKCLCKSPIYDVAIVMPLWKIETPQSKGFEMKTLILFTLAFSFPAFSVPQKPPGLDQNRAILELYSELEKLRKSQAALVEKVDSLTEELKIANEKLEANISDEGEWIGINPVCGEEIYLGNYVSWARESGYENEQFFHISSFADELGDNDFILRLNTGATPQKVTILCLPVR